MNQLNPDTKNSRKAIWSESIHVTADEFLADQPTADSYALVTGGSSGIGKAIARELARHGFNVLLVALPETGLEAVAESIRNEFGVKVDYLNSNLAVADGPEKVYHWCRLNYYAVNILVNNAGLGHLCSFESLSHDQIHYMMALNNEALVMLTHQFMHMLKNQPKSYVLNVGSLASFEPMPNKAIYAATKSFVYSFSWALRMELEDEGISVSCLCPSGVLTNQQVQQRTERISISKSFQMDAETVARKAVNCMLKGQFRIIPGWQNRFVYRLEQVLPEEAVKWLMKKLFKKLPPDTSLPGVHPHPLEIPTLPKDKHQSLVEEEALTG